jgi:hypothetical protein
MASGEESILVDGASLYETAQKQEVDFRRWGEWIHSYLTLKTKEMERENEEERERERREEGGEI